VRFAGTGTPGVDRQWRENAARLGLENRVEWLGAVSEDRKRDLYARALGVVYPPFDEDYGFVTLEAMLAGKPVVTCSDSGGTLDFVQHDQTGLVAAPDADELAAAFDRLSTDRALARRLGAAGRAAYDAAGLSWDAIVARLAA
jgi:glycosyltransferase involved in cell wall biosynthesis